MGCKTVKIADSMITKCSMPDVQLCPQGTAVKPKHCQLSVHLELAGKLLVLHKKHRLDFWLT